MFLIYTHKITPRFKYIFKHLFGVLLEFDVNFTSEVEEFIKHEGYKFSYSLLPLGDELFFESHGLLFATKIKKDLEIEVERRKEIPFFFKTSENCALGFDIFASSFYLLSRYEEYLTVKTKIKPGFSFTKSLAYKNDFLQIPVIELWVNEIFKLLKEKFPDINFPKRNFAFTSSYHVTQYWNFKKVNFIKYLLDIINDLNHKGIKSIYERFLVLIGTKKDPFDNYDEIIEDNKNYPIKTIIFFLVGDYDIILDDSLCLYNPDLHSLIKSMADHIKTGLYISHVLEKKSSSLAKEKNHIEEILHSPITKSSQDFSGLNIFSIYKKLVEVDLCEDYSMGYSNCNGFRAGTSMPFLFYDLENEMIAPLKIFPICASCFDLEQRTPSVKDIERLLDLLKIVKEVEGNFIFSLSNESLVEDSYSREVYKKLLNAL